jgi:hypothetical protein
MSKEKENCTIQKKKKRNGHRETEMNKNLKYFYIEIRK